MKVTAPNSKPVKAAAARAWGRSLPRWAGLGLPLALLLGLVAVVAAGLFLEVLVPGHHVHVGADGQVVHHHHGFFGEHRHLGGDSPASNRGDRPQADATGAAAGVVPARPETGPGSTDEIPLPAPAGEAGGFFGDLALSGATAAFLLLLPLGSPAAWVPPVGLEPRALLARHGGAPRAPPGRSFAR